VLALLRAVVDGSPRTAADIAARLGYTRSTTERHLRALHAAGVIERVSAAPEHRHAYQGWRVIQIGRYMYPTPEPRP
jgi:DNA-binding Lrp family transcriptional regulator